MTHSTSASPAEQRTPGADAKSERRHALHLHILGSGSRGNCALVEGPEGLIMIDNGFARCKVLDRMHELGLDERDVRALILTHEHTDHVSGISVWVKIFNGPPVCQRGHGGWTQVPQLPRF